MVHPPTTIGVLAQGIAHAVCDLSLFEILWFHFPDLFQTQPVRLWLRIPPQVELFYHLLCQTAVASFCKQSEAGMERHSALKPIFWLPVASNAEVVGRYALNCAVRSVYNLRP